MGFWCHHSSAAWVPHPTEAVVTASDRWALSLLRIWEPPQRASVCPPGSPTHGLSRPQGLGRWQDPQAPTEVGVPGPAPSGSRARRTPLRGRNEPHTSGQATGHWNLVVFAALRRGLEPWPGRRHVCEMSPVAGVPLTLSTLPQQGPRASCDPRDREPCQPQDGSVNVCGGRGLTVTVKSRPPLPAPRARHLQLQALCHGGPRRGVGVGDHHPLVTASPGSQPLGPARFTRAECPLQAPWPS